MGPIKLLLLSKILTDWIKKNSKIHAAHFFW